MVPRITVIPGQTECQVTESQVSPRCEVVIAADKEAKGIRSKSDTMFLSVKKHWVLGSDVNLLI